MSFQWDDKSTMIFLSAYEKHPCLWNPYDKDYYDCYIKNEALRKVTQELDIPGLFVTDCLQQIGFVRQKFAQEQQRVAKGLQAQKAYKSPFPWYDVIAEMLLKVIRDEEKFNLLMPPKGAVSEVSLKNNKGPEPSIVHTKSLADNSLMKSSKKDKPSMESGTNSFSRSNGTEHDSQQDRPETSKRKISSRHKRKDSSISQRTKSSRTNVETIYLENNFKDRRDSCYDKPKKNSKFTKAGSESIPSVTDDNKFGREKVSTPANIVPCPYYLHSIRSTINAEKDRNKPVMDLKTVSKDVSKQGELNNKVLEDLVSNVENRRKDYNGQLKKQDFGNMTICVNQFDENFKSQIATQGNREVQTREALHGKLENVEESARRNDVSTSPVTSESLEITPKMATKYENGILEAYSQFKVILPNFDQCRKSCLEEIERKTRDVQTPRSTRQEAASIARPEVRSRETQAAELAVEGKSMQTESIQELRSTETNTVEQSDKEIQSMICDFRTCTGTSYSEPSSSTEGRESVERNFPKRFDKGIQNRGCVKQSTQVEVNTLRKNSIETQSTICVSRGSLTSKKQKSSSKQTGTDAVKSRSQEAQSTVCVRPENSDELRRKNYNFTVSTSGEGHSPLITTGPNSREKYVECDSAETCCSTNIETDPSRRRHTSDNSINVEGSPTMTQILLNCLEKVLNLSDKSKIDAVASYLSKKVGAQSEMYVENICEPCKSVEERKKSQTQDPQKSLDKNENCLPCLQEAEINNVIGNLTKTFLDVVKCALDLDAKTDESRRNLNNDRRLDLTKLVDKLEKCFMTILKIDSPLKCSSKRCSNEICAKYKTKSNVQQTTEPNLMSREVQASKDLDGRKILKDSHVDSKTGPSVEVQESQVSESLTKFLEPTVEHKQVDARSEIREVGTSAASSIFADTGTQSPRKLTSDSAVSTMQSPSTRKMSIGTQKRDPILVRVIKYPEETKTQKLDKTVSALQIDLTVQKSAEKVNKCSCSSRNAQIRQAVSEYYNQESVYCGRTTKNLQKRETSKNIYKEGSVCFLNFKCNDNCKNRSSVDKDWTRIEDPTKDLYCDKSRSVCAKMYKCPKKKYEAKNRILSDSDSLKMPQYTECYAYQGI